MTMFDALFPRRSDAALVREVLRDRPQAFEALVERYQRKAHAVARAAGAATSDLDDVVQDAFLRALERLPQLREPASFGCWFLHIVRNVAASRLRACGRERDATAGAAGGAPIAAAAGAGDDHAAALERAELDERIGDAVRALPEPLREAVLIYYYEGASVAEAARALGTSRVAVRKRLERGRALLREEIWRRLRHDLEAVLPAPQEWRRRARRTTLLLFGATAAAWGIGAGAASAASAAGGAGAAAAAPSIIPASIHGIGLGGISMSIKKIAAAAVVAACLMASGLWIATRPAPRARPNGDVASGAPAVVAPAAPRSNPEAGAGPEAPAPTTASSAATAVPPAPPILSGRVLGPDGALLSGARVAALDIAAWESHFESLDAERVRSKRRDLADGLGRMATALLHRADTASIARGAYADDGGVYAFTELPAGDHRLLAAHPGFLPSLVEVVRIEGDAPVARDIVLDPAAAIDGIVVDEDGEPIAGATVRARAVELRTLRSEAKRDRLLASWREGALVFPDETVASGRDGRFTLRSLAPGLHDVIAGHERFVETRAEDTPAPGPSVRIVMGRGARLTGTIADPAGAPVEGARVTLDPMSADRPRPGTLGTPLLDHVPADFDAGAAGQRAADTDALGAFAIEAVARGRYTLRIVHDRDAFPAIEEIVDAGAEAIDLGELRFEAAAAIAGIVRDRNGAAIANALVWLEDVPRGGIEHWGGRQHGAETIGELVTAAGGAFAFELLAPGTYALHASSPRHAPRAVGGVVAGGPPVDIVLDDGRAARGVVLDAVSRAPIAGARVVALLGLAGLPVRGKEAIADAAGRFELFGLPEAGNDALRLEATHDGFPGASGRTDIARRDEAAPVEILLRAPEAIAGLVTDASGEPVAGAAMRLVVHGANTQWLRRLMTGGNGSARSGADGRFELRVPGELHAGSFRPPLEVAARHPARGSGRAGPFEAPAAGLPWPEVEIALLPAVDLAGTVSDARGAPIAGAVVVATRHGDAGGIDERPLRAVTDDRGRYRLRGLDPAPHDVEVRALGYAPAKIEEVGAGALDVTLTGGRGIEGIIVDSAGAPVAAAEVVAIEFETSDGEDCPPPCDGRDISRRSLGVVVASRRAGADGAYAFEHLPDRKLTLYAWAPGFAPSPIRVVAADATTAEPLVLVPYGAIAGVVVAEENGRPVAPFHVMARTDTRGERGAGGETYLPREYADARGRFVLEDLRPGAYLIGISAPGFATWGERVVVEPGRETTLAVALARGATVRGAVFDKTTGAPIEGAGVSVQPHGDESVAAWLMGLPGMPSTRTAADGSFAIADVARGKQWVHVYLEGYNDGGDSRRIDVGDVDPEPLRLTLIRGGSVRGRIAIEPEGARVLDRVIVLTPLPGGGGEEFRIHGVDPNGEYAASGIVPATYDAHLELRRVDDSKLRPDGVIPAEAMETETIPLGRVTVEAGGVGEIRVVE